MTDVTNRFIEAYNLLLSIGMVINAKDFCQKIDISTSMFTEILKGRSNVGVKAIQNTVNTFNISPFYIFSGEGDVLIEKNGHLNDKKNTSENTHPNTHLLDKIEDKTESHAVLRKELYQDEQNIELLALQAEKGIPLIPDYAFAGFAPGSETQILELNCEKYVIPHFKGADGLIHVKGSSMYPKYNSGDIVAFKKLSMGTFFQWNKVYIIDTEQGLLIKRVQQADDDEHVLLVSENPSYKPFPLPLTDIYSLAIVVGVIRLE